MKNLFFVNLWPIVCLAGLVFVSCQEHISNQKTTAIVLFDQTDSCFIRSFDPEKTLTFLCNQAGIGEHDEACGNGLSIQVGMLSHLHQNPVLGTVTLPCREGSGILDITKDRLDAQQAFYKEAQALLMQLYEREASQRKHSRIFQPLMQAIQQLSEVEGQRILVLYSDIMHHTKDYSMYSQGVEGLFALGKQYPADFTRPIDIYVIAHDTTEKLSVNLQRSEKLWRAFFADWPAIRLHFKANL